LCGRPMLIHVFNAMADLPMDRAVVVVGKGAEQVTKTLQDQAPSHLAVDVVEQRAARGTGDAVAAALTAFLDDDEEADLLVVPSDVPLLRGETLYALVGTHRSDDAAATILTANYDDASGYGRVVRDKNGGVEYIVDHVDASPAEREVREVNT